ncbi:hypothetical protein [Cytobacillus oceanisediminis]|uniref:hypothetical protein n=1 Tax=Cytobacillus oceanisediminis TaxID=665099 RepID=UPI00203C518A|nr:hypothetical protein [Cytobacillus oceanisediminis]MCM3405474.1 hypothetical protein [Cytobacillus oceanisediminis]
MSLIKFIRKNELKSFDARKEIEEFRDIDLYKSLKDFFTGVNRGLSHDPPYKEEVQEAVLSLAVLITTQAFLAIRKLSRDLQHLNKYDSWPIKLKHGYSDNNETSRIMICKMIEVISDDCHNIISLSNKLSINWNTWLLESELPKAIGTFHTINQIYEPHLFHLNEMTRIYPELENYFTEFGD